MRVTPYERTAMFEFTAFLYMLFYGLVAAAIPLVMLMFLVRIIIKSLKKTYRIARY